MSITQSHTAFIPASKDTWHLYRLVVNGTYTFLTRVAGSKGAQTRKVTRDQAAELLQNWRQVGLRIETSRM